MAERKRLTRTDWTDAALGAIAQGGLAAVSVMGIATALGATKGSFYWHFESREALLEAALDAWEQQHTLAVLAAVAATATEADLQLRTLIATVIDTAERDPVGLALLATADHPAVAPVLARVTQTRLGAITALMARLGLPPERARLRAVLAYSAYLGHAQLAHTTPQVLPADRRAYLDEAVQVLTLVNDG